MSKKKKFIESCPGREVKVREFVPVNMRMFNINIILEKKLIHRINLFGFDANNEIETKMKYIKLP